MKKEPQVKQCWRGVFNYRHSVYVLYCYAVSERKAYVNFCSQLAKKHEVAIWHVMSIFNGKDNYRIEREVKKWKITNY